MTKLEQVVTLIKERNPLQGKQMCKTLPVLTTIELAEAERTLDFFTNQLDYSITEISDAYLWFIDKFMEAQLDFARTGKYQHSTFAEIQDYYSDINLMRSYVISLAVTLYLFPQHLDVTRFYKKAVANANPNTAKTDARYLEIGPGHGHLFVTAMENSNFSSYVAVDISQSSVDISSEYVKYCLPDKTNWRILREDFFDFDSGSKFDALVMGEVLEHVEYPEKFLSKIRELAKPDTFIYITTAVNAPCFDHIYLFHTVDEVEEMFNRRGLKVKDKIYGIANGAGFEKAVKKKYAIVPAYVLEIG